MIFYFVVILIKLIILSQIKKIGTVFVSVADYSEEGIRGLNLPECGLSLEPIKYEITFNNTCFKKSYKDKTVLIFEKRHLIPSKRVFKGRDSQVGEAPWAVYLYGTRLKWDKIICSGSLLTPEWVITAAHCLEDWKDFWLSGETITLSMGPIREEGLLHRTVDKKDFFAHNLFLDPGSAFNRSMTPERKDEIKYQHDIGLIRLRKPIEHENTFDRRFSINTICLPKRGETEVKRDERAKFYGFGKINDKFLASKYLPKQLQEGWVVMRRFGECGSWTIFCGWFAGDDPRPCPGDSGGPMVQYVEKRTGVKRAVLIGTLVSAGPSTATQCTRDITNANWVAVPKFIDWIFETIKANSLYFGD